VKYSRLGLATVAAFVFLMVINALLFPFVFPDRIPEHYQNQRPAPLYEFHSLAFLLTTFLLAFIYPYGYKGGTPWIEGARFGALIALFVSIPMGMHLYAMVEISAAKTILPILWTTLTWSAAGAAIGLVYGKTEKPR
jgi:hypothetical protein